MKKWIHHLRRVAYSIRYYYKVNQRFSQFDLPQLTREEKYEVRKTWPGVTIIPLDWICVRVFKKIHGFSPYYLAPCWWNELRVAINPRDQLYSLENKALCDIYFPDLSFPETYVRGLNGNFYDKDMNFISGAEAVALLKCKGEYVIKPAIGTLQGQGVKKVNSQKDSIIDSFKTGGGNFIAQEVLKQAIEIEELNPSSLNCFRVTTIYLNGVFDFATSLKVGKAGAFRDNWNSAYWIDVSKKGVLSEFGFDYDVNAVSRSDGGIAFKGRVIPHFQDMIDHLEKMHKKLFANCGVIGWDVTLDRDYKVRIIETNLYNPGTNIEQFVSGDFFKAYRDVLLNAFNKR